MQGEQVCRKSRSTCFRVSQQVLRHALTLNVAWLLSDRTHTAGGLCVTGFRLDCRFV